MPKNCNSKQAMNFPIFLAMMIAMASTEPAASQNTPNCETSCGSVGIEFPFGTGEGCYYSSNFLITCDRSSGRPIPYYQKSKSNIVISNMSMSSSEMEILKTIAHDCYDQSGQVPDRSNTWSSLTLSEFRISTKNRFVAIGCDTYAYINETRGNESYGTGCISRCDSNRYVKNGSCSGVGCCATAIPEGMSSFNVTLSSFTNHKNITGFNPCSHAFVVAEDKFEFLSNYLIDFESVSRMPMLLDWAIGSVTCDEARTDTANFQCKANSQCDHEYRGPGYRCKCLEGYQGNPYLGCEDIKECENPNNDCIHKDKYCTEELGNYTCFCPKGYHGDGRKSGKGCIQDQSLVNKIAISTSVSVTGLLICIIWLYLGLKKRKLMKLKEKYFKQNGGTILRQRLSSKGEGSHEAAKIFTSEELKKATDNYNESRIIGKGGNGTVYKGVLSDKRIVAIKKSGKVDQTQTEQFVNEVIILSQINHRNVVKLLGCCPETEVPLLVYEFIPNGTLSDHIHDETKAPAITWDIRVRIATGTAGALSYLHFEASESIIHRDVKSMNILLDKNYVAKVSDFGASRLIPMDQKELATIVLGTQGYLDPEYLRTEKLTEKSDVYSFGVVLLELLTGRRAHRSDGPEEERNLVNYFLSSLNEGRLPQVVDERVMQNENTVEITQVSTLAKRCVSVTGEERPTMKEVAMELEAILASMEQKRRLAKSTSNEEETELNSPTKDHEKQDKTSSDNTATFDSMSKHPLHDTGR